MQSVTQQTVVVPFIAVVDGNNAGKQRAVLIAASSNASPAPPYRQFYTLSTTATTSNPAARTVVSAIVKTFLIRFTLSSNDDCKCFDLR